MARKNIPTDTPNRIKLKEGLDRINDNFIELYDIKLDKGSYTGTGDDIGKAININPDYNGSLMRIWAGTQAQYDAQKPFPNDVITIIQPEGEIPIPPDTLPNGIKNVKVVQNDNLANFDRQTEFGGIMYDDFVHPCVLYFENLWNGHQWWMGVNAYGATQGITENPYLFYSDDGVTWKTPIGANNPIYVVKSGFQHNSDVFIFMEGSTMHLINRAVRSNGTAVIDLISSTDAVNWTSPVDLMDSANSTPDLVSPSIIFHDNKWHLFGTDVNDTSSIKVFTSDTLTGTYTLLNTISNGAIFTQVWHTEVRKQGAKFYILGTTGGVAGGNLIIGSFDSVMDTEINYRLNNLLIPKGDKSYNTNFYKSSLVFKEDGSFQIFGGLKGDALSSTTGWRVEKIQTTIYNEDLDLTQYTLLNSYTDNDVANGFLNGKIKFDHHRYLISFKLKNNVIDVIAFAGKEMGPSSAASNNYKLFINNNKSLETNVHYLAIDAYNFISYGVSKNDEIVMEQTETELRTYINGKLISIDSPDILKNAGVRGTLFGASEGDLYDIKFYKKPEYIYDLNGAQNEIDLLFDDAISNPSGYLLVDKFDRATLGTTSDNGVTYEITGSPTISSNHLKPTNSGMVKAPYSGDVSIYFRLLDAYKANGLIKVRLFETDSNNFAEIRQVDPTTTQRMRFYYTVSGTQSNFEIVMPRSPIFNICRIDIIGSKMIIYNDGVYMCEYEIPSSVLSMSKKIGLGSVYANTHYDYILIKNI